MLIIAIREDVIRGGEVIIKFVLRENPAFLSYFSFSYFLLLRLIIKAFSLISLVILNFFCYI